MNSLLMGMPDVDDMALELYLEGFRSCEAADAYGWTLTSNGSTRDFIDAVLMRLWIRRDQEVLIG